MKIEKISSGKFFFQNPTGLSLLFAAIGHSLRECSCTFSLLLPPSYWTSCPMLANSYLLLVCSCNLLRICCKGIHSSEVPPWKRRPSIQRYLRRHFENRGTFLGHIFLHLSYELHAMVSINKMLSCHAHFVLYLLQGIEFVVSVVSVALSGCTGGLYSTTLTGQLSEHWHFWTVSTLAPRKGLNGEIKKPFGIGFNLWWVWLATRWYAFRALFPCNNPHSLVFRGSLSSWMGGGHDLTWPICSTKFLALSSLF